MKQLLNKTIITTSLVLGLLFTQVAMSDVPARAFVFDGKLLTGSDLQNVQVSLPGLYNPLTSKRSTREDFEKPAVISKGFDVNSSLFEASQYKKELLQDVTLEIDILSAEEQQTASYLTTKMKNVDVTSYSDSGSAGADIPTEEVALNFEEIKIE